MKVVFTPRARRRTIAQGTWWRANRPAAPGLFELELEDARRQLTTQPTSGHLYAAVGGRVVRRLLLPKTEQHVYNSVDQPADLVVVHTVWGARRGGAPSL